MNEKPKSRTMVTHVALASTKATNCHTDVLTLNYQNETLDGFDGESNFLHTILRQENEDIVFFPGTSCRTLQCQYFVQ